VTDATNLARPSVANTVSSSAGNEGEGGRLEGGTIDDLDLGREREFRNRIGRGAGTRNFVLALRL
jgi:hypothetical protein